MSVFRRRGVKMMIGILIFILVLGAVAIYQYFKNGLWGFSSWSKKDANPAPEEIKVWSVKNFDSRGWKIWNLNPNFTARKFDSGNLTDTLIKIAPWGKKNWGFQVYGWEGGCDNSSQGGWPVTVAKFFVADGSAYILIENNNNRFANAALIQGWNWGSSEDVPWYCPPLFKVADRKIILSLDLKIDLTGEEETGGFIFNNKWLMMSATFWFRSSDLPKPLVIDLAFYLNREIMYSKEDCAAYHYQKVVVQDKKEALSRWRHYDIDLSWFIADALKRFNIEYAGDGLTLFSMEFLIESKGAKGSFSISHFALYYK